MKASHVFDAPDRSQRGRTITHGFFFELAHNQWTGLSDVRADDDAAEVRWVPIVRVPRHAGAHLRRPLLHREPFFGWPGPRTERPLLCQPERRRLTAANVKGAFT
jgi:ADP-ribose pyrophosphatase YjhB (NUDIX family)